MFINRQMDKQNLLHTNSRILLIFKKEGNPNTCYNMNEP